MNFIDNFWEKIILKENIISIEFLENLPYTLRNNPNFMLNLIKKFNYAIIYISDDLKNNKNFALSLAKENNYFINFFK